MSSAPCLLPRNHSHRSDNPNHRPDHRLRVIISQGSVIPVSGLFCTSCCHSVAHQLDHSSIFAPQPIPLLSLFRDGLGLRGICFYSASKDPATNLIRWPEIRFLFHLPVIKQGFCSLLELPGRKWHCFMDLPGSCFFVTIT